MSGTWEWCRERRKIPSLGGYLPPSVLGNGRTKFRLTPASRPPSGRTYSSRLFVGLVMEYSKNKNKNDVREEELVGGEARVVVERLPLSGASTPSFVRPTSKFFAQSQSGEDQITRDLQLTDTDASDAGSGDSRCRSAMSVGSVRRTYLKRTRSIAGTDSDSGSASGVAHAAKIVAARGRGQGALTHGKYVGIGRAREQVAARKAADKAHKKEEAEKRVEEIAQKASEERASRLSGRLSLEMEELPAAALKSKLEDAVLAIGSIAKISKSLKGTSQRGLKDAAATIAEVAEVLFSRTASEESKSLRRENARLAAQVEELREEHRALKADLAKLRRTRTEGPELEQTPDIAALLQKELAQINSRFSTLEGRLLRPPLGQSAQASSSQPATLNVRAKANSTAKSHPAAPSYAAVASISAPPAGKKRKPVAITSAQASKTKKAPPPKDPNNWEVVGAKKKAQKQAKKTRQAAKKKAAQLRTPRSSAVVLTLQPAAVEAGATYASILAQAKTAINPADLGIESGLRLKPTQTGARLLEVPGATSGGKADALAAKLRALFPADHVKVSRPVKSASLRISGLDDSATVEEVAAAVARVGDCAPEEIKAGAIRRGLTGLGTVVVSCPVSAAQKLEKGRRLLIGWVSAQVKLLEARPTRCYRCLQPGHVGARCSAEGDMAGRCFRCSQPGHKAASCEATPHCATCAAAGRPAEHRVGTKACGRPATKANGKKRKAEGQKKQVVADVAQRQPAAGGEDMDQ